MHEKTLLLGALAATAIAAGFGVYRAHAHGNGEQRPPSLSITPVARLDSAHIVRSADVPVRLTAADGTGLRLVSIKGSAAIEDPLALTELHLVFVNPEDRVLEGTFTIALPQGATVSRFAMKLGDVWQEGEIVERQRAREVYEDFLHRKQDPALMEQSAGNELSARVFPIPARGTKEIIVTYAETLEGGAPYVLPLKGLPALASIDVDVHASGSRSSGNGVFGLHQMSFTPADDFVVGATALPRSDGLKNGELVIARVVPFATSRPDPVESAVVLVDTSASRALGLAEQAPLVQHVLARLRPDAPVTVACFDQEVVPIYEGTAGGFGEQATRAILQRGALGASDFQQAIAWAGGEAKRKGLRRVIVVGDGVATAGETDAQKIKLEVEKLRAAKVDRLDAIAVGGIRDDAFLRSLVRGVLDRDGVVLDGAIGEDGLARRLGEATSSGVAVKVDGATWSWPRTLDGLQAGDEVIVHAEVPPGTPVRIDVGGQQFTPDLRTTERPLIERSWAQAKIQSLLEAPIADAATTRRDIVALGTRFRVVSPYTALLVLETDDDYARFGIDRKATREILSVEDGRIAVRQAPPAELEKKAKGEKKPDEQNDQPADLGGKDHQLEPAAPASEAEAPETVTKEEAGKSKNAVAPATSASSVLVPPKSPPAGHSVPGTHRPATVATADNRPVPTPPSGGPRSEKRLPLLDPWDSEPPKDKPRGNEPEDRDGLDDESTPAPKPPPVPNPSPAPTLAPSPTTSPVPTPSPAPKPRPAAPAPPREKQKQVEQTIEPRLPAGEVRLGELVVERGLSGDEAARVVRRALPQLRACYSLGLALDPSMRDELVLRIEVDGSGAVQQVTPPEGGKLAPSVRDCSIAVLRGLRFPKPAGPSAAMTATLRFLPEIDLAPSPEVADAPSESAPYEGRFKTVMDLLAHGEKERALDEARSWRAEQPADVMALVALGEALEANGDVRTAARAYGSILELHPSRADSRRFAGERLEHLADPAALRLAVDTFAKAVAERPDHPSSHRLYAFALLRQGEHEKAFAALRAGAERTYPSNRFRGALRVLHEDLGLVAAAWTRAEPRRAAAIHELLRAAGGQEETAPSLRFVLVWETDASDVDFHIRDARGGHAFYKHKELASGGSLYADVTTGYGPECFTVRSARGARAYPYRLAADYFSRGPMGYGMGKLELIEHDGSGNLVFDERPFVVMADHATVDLGTVGPEIVSSTAGLKRPPK